MVQRFILKVEDRLLPRLKKYSAVAPEYFITQMLSFWDAPWKEELIADLPENIHASCVDIACGMGDLSFLLAKKYPQGRVVGLDIEKQVLDIAHSRNTCRHLDFVQQDMRRLPFPSGSIDIMTGGYALREAALDLDAVLNEIHRVLKPGGIAAFLDVAKPASPFLQRLEYGMLKIWSAFWGWLLHADRDAYRHIAERQRLFPDGLHLREMLWKKGFLVVAAQSYLFGIAERVTVRKMTGQGAGVCLL